MTFLEMQTRLNNKLDDAGNVRWTLALKKQNLNEAYKHLYSIMVERGAINVKTGSISVVAGTQEYNLPSDFGLAYGKPYRTTDYMEFDICDYKDHDFDTDNGAARSTPCLCYFKNNYRVETSASYAVIGLRPIPDTSFTMYVDYLPQMTDMSQDTDVSLVPAMFHDLIILRGAIICLEDVANEDARYKNYAARYADEYKQFEKYICSHVRGVQRPFVDVMEPDVNYND